MNTQICALCGCSLIRLGIATDKAQRHTHKGVEYNFCCKGCITEFITAPEQYLKETQDLTVCPICLAEKPPQFTVGHEFAGTEYRLCRCPCCLDRFKEDPRHYIKRLEGKIPFTGIFYEIT